MQGVARAEQKGPEMDIELEMVVKEFLAAIDRKNDMRTLKQRESSISPRMVSALLRMADLVGVAKVDCVDGIQSMEEV